ncbi:hypothetical protein C8R43DRAFT_127490 [Mycena crocata]|nr:hypothetical protein C8R43DRAFT_127490 [Mycena crocata]
MSDVLSQVRARFLGSVLMAFPRCRRVPPMTSISHAPCSGRVTGDYTTYGNLASGHKLQLLPPEANMALTFKMTCMCPPLSDVSCTVQTYGADSDYTIDHVPRSKVELSVELSSLAVVRKFLPLRSRDRDHRVISLIFSRRWYFLYACAFQTIPLRNSTSDTSQYASFLQKPTETTHFDLFRGSRAISSPAVSWL